MKKNIILFLVLIFSLSYCKTTEFTDEAVDFQFASQGKTYPLKDKRSEEFVQFIQKAQEKNSSFTADFSLKIEQTLPKKETFFADGKIFYSKESGNLKIQLMDTFLGFIFTEVIADPIMIRIRQSNVKQVMRQPMGDIVIEDPNRGKKFIIPFEVLYLAMSAEYMSEFSKQNAKVNPIEKKVYLLKNKDEYQYFFSDRGLERLELISNEKKLKAISKNLDTSIDLLQPPKKLVTKVVTIDDDKDEILIQTILRNLKKGSVPESVFQF